MNNTMSNQDTLPVLWRCDKRDCGKINYRVLPKGQTIANDECEHCRRTVREPLWEVVKPKGKN